MYTYRQLPSTIDGIESLNFSAYWKSIKDKIEDLRNLPTWATNHAMKLGVTYSNLKKAGNYAAANAMDTEIKKVNDDIAKAWKVKQYIDRYLPEWMSVANNAANNGAPIVPSQKPATTTVPVATTSTPTVYTQPSLTQDITGWVGSWFGSGSGVNGLGIAPLIPLSVAAIGGLTYTVTVGMSLWQDYKFKKDLTQQMIEGKVTSGQIAQVLTAARPPESLLEKVASQAGGNLATIAVLGALGYAAFWYLTSKKALS